MDEVRGSSLLCRVGVLLCALPLEHVEETMRPLRTEPVLGAPPFVRGLAVVRGAAIPVVDGGLLLGGRSTHATRFVSVKVGVRHVVIAVDAVVGISRIPPASLEKLPPLLRDSTTDVVASLGTLDAELLLVLRSSRLVPDDVWALLHVEDSAA